jgi:hypothetical protein
MPLISGWIAKDQQLNAAETRFDGDRTAAGDLDAAAHQSRDVHGTAVDVKQFPLQAMLGKEALLLGHPEKGLGRIDG